MDDQYEAWLKTGPHGNIKCVDCHLPNHNPPEALRVPGDSLAHASKAEAFLRQALTAAGVNVPADPPLELNRYLSNRGIHNLQFMPEQEVKDPFGRQQKFTPRASKGLR